jgi:hypothetical protein
VRVVGAGRALLEAHGGRSGSLALLYSSAVLVPAAIDYPSLGYEHAERCRNPSRPVAHTHAGLGRRHDAVLTSLATSGAFRGVLVTIAVTRAGLLSLPSPLPSEMPLRNHAADATVRRGAEGPWAWFWLHCLSG